MQVRRNRYRTTAMQLGTQTYPLSVWKEDAGRPSVPNSSRTVKLRKVHRTATGSFTCGGETITGLLYMTAFAG